MINVEEELKEWMNNDNTELADWATDVANLKEQHANGELADDEYKEVLVDQSEVESGLQEAIKLLSTGDRAKFIIPSHIAHGLLGDLNKIPPLRTLVIDLTLLGKTK